MAQRRQRDGSHRRRMRGALRVCRIQILPHWIARISQFAEAIAIPATVPRAAKKSGGGAEPQPLARTRVPALQTVSTEFVLPKSFATVSLAEGSLSHCPSTTKRYS